MTRALAQVLWSDAQTDADLRALLRSSYRGRHDVLDALWWRVHPFTSTPGGRPDPAIALRDIQAAFFSRAAAAEAAEAAPPAAPSTTDPSASDSGRDVRRRRKAELASMQVIADQLIADATALDELLQSFESADDLSPREQTRADTAGSSPLPSSVTDQARGAETGPAGLPVARPPSPSWFGRFRSVVAHPLVASALGGVLIGVLATAIVLGAQDPSSVLHSPTASPTPRQAAQSSESETTNDALVQADAGPSRRHTYPIDALAIFERPAEGAPRDNHRFGLEYLPSSVISLESERIQAAGLDLYAAQRPSGQYCLVLVDVAQGTFSACSTKQIIVQVGIRLAATAVAGPTDAARPKRSDIVEVRVTVATDGSLTSSVSPVASASPTQ